MFGQKSQNKIEKHPFKPFLPQGTKVVLCGTFPPKPEKWSMDFFYPNFYNDMWRVFGLIFYNQSDYFFNTQEKSIDKEGIKQTLSKFKIGISETATEVIRTKGNASDKFLEIIKPVNLSKLLSKIPDCKAVVTTGEKASSIIADLTGTSIPKMGEKIECEIKMDNDTIRKINHWRMPSTSRAYPMKLETKAHYYAEMFKTEGILTAKN